MNLKFKNFMSDNLYSHSGKYYDKLNHGVINR